MYVYVFYVWLFLPLTLFSQYGYMDRFVYIKDFNVFTTHILLISKSKSFAWPSLLHGRLHLDLPQASPTQHVSSLT